MPKISEKIKLIETNLRIRKYLFTGLIAILPLWLTIIIIWFVFKFVGGLSRPFLSPIFKFFFGYTQTITLLNITSFFLTLVVIYLVGLLATNIISKRVLGGMESLLNQVPFLKRIYPAAKKLTQYIFTLRREYQRVVLIEFPRKGVYSIGFITSEISYAEVSGQKLFNVFVPTTPNPTTGYLIIAPESELIKVDLKIEEAINMILSGGIVQPEKVDG